LPLFPFVPIVVPPGGQWPGEPPTGGGQPPTPGHDLPLFPFFPISGWDPATGTWPEAPTGPEPPEPVDPNAPTPSHPINLPPSDTGWWVEVYIPGQGWGWVAISPQPLPPRGEMPAPK
jgi:hypothetical protein